MKLPRLITPRQAKWVGLISSILLMLVYVSSNWIFVAFVWNSPSIARHVSVAWGQIGGAIWYDDGEFRFYNEPNGFHLDTQRTISGMPFGWWFHGGISEPVRFVTGLKTRHWVTIPLWFPLLFIAAPTAWLWHTDRRAKPWQCPKCRYDLRGLEGGVCPECGEGGVH